MCVCGVFTVVSESGQSLTLFVLFEFFCMYNIILSLIDKLEDPSHKTSVPSEPSEPSVQDRGLNSTQDNSTSLSSEHTMC